ncbi:LysR substrate-binding domain-containing protein [Lichenihabitans psoromatis]|uniref:LysR substrate-binding domain-containing protein n=1 Tax=Lichenihabitans psoromatis TaxID=2528642 RepID=UPI0010384EEB|nr:LysR substrate-binding domain-containing protein [Lichenihabitans psoromatis]
MTLTPSGQRFYQHALQLHGRAREFEQKILGERNEVAGEIAVACFESLAPLYAPALIASFQREFPGVMVRLDVGAQERIIQGLRSGAYDVAICYSQGLPKSISQVGLLPDLYPHAILPMGHRLAGSGPVSLSMLTEDPFILLDIWPSNEYFLSLFKDAGLNPKIAYHAPSLELVRGLVGQGLGFSLLVTEPVNNTTFDGKEVISLPLSDRLAPSRIVMSWNGSSELTHTMRQFLRHCQAFVQIPKDAAAQRRETLAIVSAVSRAGVPRG